MNMTVAIAGTNNHERVRANGLLALHAAARPKHCSEPIPRENMAAENKLAAEAGPEEIKMILGWLCDFRRLLVSLPDNKYRAWSGEIRDLLNRGRSTAKELRTNVGRLGHAAMVLPQMNHFMSRIRDLEDAASNRRWIKISKVVREDLELMLFFLRKAHEGVDMNLLVPLFPDIVYRSDSCPAGMGGYSNQGWAWRWYIPEDLQFRASNNLLEHLAAIITPWIDLIMGRLVRGMCYLSMTDSSTSEGWQHRTNFTMKRQPDPVQAEARIEVARSHAMRTMEAGVVGYGQWFPGDENDVSDCLSRDMDRSDEELTNILRKFVPEQMPDRFEIVPLPNEIVSWLTSLLQTLPVKEQLRERHTMTKLGRGDAGSSGASPPGSNTTTSSSDSARASGSDSSERLPWLCGEDDFLERLMRPWLKAQSEMPFHMWHRPSETQTSRTQRRTKMASLADFYRANSGRTETQTPTPSSRKPSQ